MKQNKKLIVLALFVLLLSGWKSTLSGTQYADKKEYENLIIKADTYQKKELYQKAGRTYEKVAEKSNEKKYWKKMDEAYKKIYSSSPEVYQEYSKALIHGIDMNPQDIYLLKSLTKISEEKEDYDGVYKCLKKAMKNGGKKKKEINSLFKQVRYAYTLDWNSFENYKKGYGECYSVEQLGVWSLQTSDGEADKVGKVDKAGYIGNDNVCFVKKDGKNQIIDTDNVLQGRLDETPEETGCYADGLLPVKMKSEFMYCNSMGECKLSGYMDGSNFTTGKAAVKDKNSKWYIIDKEGKKEGEKYQDIKLNPQRDFVAKDVFSACKAKKYNLYNLKGKKISSVNASDMDAPVTGEGIAYKKNSKWGYIDAKGNKIIKPQYQDAKSFSHGLAGIYDGKKWGFINENGELVIECVFEDVGYFDSGNKCMVKIGKDEWKQLSFYVS